MKNLKKYIMIVCLATIIVSCNDKFMQQDPIQELAEGAFFKNEGDLPLYLNQLYQHYIQGHDSSDAYNEFAPLGIRGSQLMYADLASDNAVGFTGTAGDPNSRLTGTFISPTTAAYTNGWMWVKLRAVNYFLRYYRDAEGSVAVPSQLNKWAAEAYFFKAMDYYEKLYTFGEVPWFTTDLSTGSEELYAPRTPRVQLVDSIMMCINYAVEHLTINSGSDRSFGRVNKDMALFLKARFCLFEGSFRKYHTELGLTGTANEFFQQAAEAANELMTCGRYELYDNQGTKSTDREGNDAYWYMFRLNQTPAADNNREAILARVYDGVRIGHGSPRYFNMNRGNAGGRYSKGATKGLVDDYLCIDGQSISTSPLFKGYDGMWEELDNRDPRLRQTVVKPGEYITIFDRDKGTIDRAAHGLKYPNVTYNCPSANQDASSGPCITGYLFIKHWTPAFEDNGSANRGRQTALIYRLGEAMLIYAEARAELGLLTNDDLDRTVNKLRERAGFDFTTYPNAKLTIGNMPEDPRLDEIYAQYLDYSVSPLLREIRRERRVELALEGMRREDLVRWKAGKLMEVPLRGMKFTAEKQTLYNGSNTGAPIWAPAATLNSDVFVDSDGFIIAYPRTANISNGTLVWYDRYYYWPIPLRELELNPNLTQNTGWLGVN